MLAIEGSLSPIIWDQLGQHSEASSQKQWVYSTFMMYFLYVLESAFLWSTERKQTRAWSPVSEHALYTRLKVMVITGVGQPNVYTTQPHFWALEAEKTNGSPWKLSGHHRDLESWVILGNKEDSGKRKSRHCPSSSCPCSLSSLFWHLCLTASVLSQTRS